MAISSACSFSHSGLKSCPSDPWLTLARTSSSSRHVVVPMPSASQSEEAGITFTTFLCLGLVYSTTRRSIVALIVFASTPARIGVGSDGVRRPHGLHSTKMRKRTLSVRVDGELWERIELLAVRQRRTVSQMTEIMLEQVVVQFEEEVIKQLLREVRNGSND